MGAGQFIAESLQSVLSSLFAIDVSDKTVETLAIVLGLVALMSMISCTMRCLRIGLSDIICCWCFYEFCLRDGRINEIGSFLPL